MRVKRNVYLYVCVWVCVCMGVHMWEWGLDLCIECNISEIYESSTLDTEIVSRFFYRGFKIK